MILEDDHFNSESSFCQRFQVIREAVSSQHNVFITSTQIHEVDLECFEKNVTSERFEKISICMYDDNDDLRRISKFAYRDKFIYELSRSRILNESHLIYASF